MKATEVEGQILLRMKRYEFATIGKEKVVIIEGRPGDGEMNSSC